MIARTSDDGHSPTHSEHGSHPGLDWAFSSQPIDGETECGDTAVVVSTGASSVIGVFDGLGHGPRAALASAIAVAEIRHMGVAPLAEIWDSLHGALRRTRGVVAAVLRIDVDDEGGSNLQWFVVGDIDARLFRFAAEAEPSVVGASSRGGIVGARMPTLHISSVPMRSGDTLVCTSDGIRSGWVPPRIQERPRDAALRIGTEGRRGTDDSLVFVGRCSLVRP